LENNQFDFFGEWEGNSKKKSLAHYPFG
jgi:hypothetical protein